MDIKKLWNEKKWLFFLLLPVIVIYVISDYFKNALIDGGREKLKETQKTDKKLEKEHNDLIKESEKHEARADQIEEEIQRLRDE
jgi:uncharacterized membrane protein (DUF106 family)